MDIVVLSVIGESIIVDVVAFILISVTGFIGGFGIRNSKRLDEIEERLDIVEKRLFGIDSDETSTGFLQDTIERLERIEDKLDDMSEHHKNNKND